MENQKPFVSIIMPVYNAEKYLEKSVTCVLNQTFTNIELILINDSSIDSSKEICQKYQNKDERVKFIDLEVNGGAGNARNKGIENAKGIYISFVDADDEIDLDLYEKAVEATKNATIDMVVWGMTELYFNKKDELNSKNIVSAGECLWQGKKALCEGALELEAKTLFGYQCNKLYKLSIIRENEISFEKVILYEDFFFTLRFAEKINSMISIPSNGYYYYKRFNDSITTRYVPEYFELSRRRILEMYNFCKKENVIIQAQLVLGNIYMRYILSAAMRNEDKRSGLSKREKVFWFSERNKDRLYREITKECAINSTVLKILKRFIDNEKYFMCIMMGKAVYIVKTMGPLLFAKIKRTV